MNVRFWGVRGSCPTSVGSEEVETRLVQALRALGQDSAPPDLSDEVEVRAWVSRLPFAVRATAGGNTPCIEMQTDAGATFIIDLGSGARALGESLMAREFGRGQGRAHVFLSHLHWDHIQGWPFFRPAYRAGNRFKMWARHEGIEEYLRMQQSEPFFPPESWQEMAAEITFRVLGDEPIELEGVRVSSLELNHPSRSFAYRFECDGKTLVYASDSSYPVHGDAHCPTMAEDALGPYLDFYRGADLVIFDSQFSPAETLEKGSWGHSSAVIGAELACRANVRQLALFHHDPRASDATLETLLATAQAHLEAMRHARGCACGPETRVLLAREGLSLSL